jgi:hypothetical protein
VPLRAGSAKISGQEERAEGEIDSAKDKIAGLHAFLQNQDNHGNGVHYFFENGGNHHWAKTDGVSGDEDESDLPNQSDADEAVEESWVSDGWRIVLTNEIEHEVQRGDDEEAPDGGDPENDSCKFQCRLLLE